MQVKQLTCSKGALFLDLHLALLRDLDEMAQEPRNQGAAPSFTQAEEGQHEDEDEDDEDILVQSLTSRRSADAVGIDCKDEHENDDDGDDDDDDDDDGDVCFPEAQECDHDSPLGEQFANEAQENMQRIIKEELQLSANMAAEASLREERRRLEREAVCYRCESGKEMPDNQVMLCDNLLCATIAWHQLCLEPPILEIPDGIWFCPICADNGVAERSVTVNEKLREQEPVPGPASVPVIPPRDGPRGKSEKRLGGAGSSSDPLQAQQMPPPRRVAKRVDKVEAAALTNGEPSRHNGAKDSVEALEAEEAMAHETATVLATVKRAPLSARSAPRPPCPSESEPSASTALGKRKAACKPPASCAVAGSAAPSAVRQRRGMQQLEWSGELAKGTRLEMLFDPGYPHEKWYKGSVEKCEMHWDQIMYCIHFEDGDQRWMTPKQLSANQADGIVRGIRP